MSLWNLSQSDNTKHSPYKRTCININQNQRASFCICPKASYTLEAAVVIPLLAGYLVTLLFFFSVLEIQCEVDEALMYAGRKCATEASVTDSEEVLFLSAEAHLIYALKDNALVEKYVQHGALGIHLWQSEFEGEKIVIRADYIVKLPISFFQIGQMELSTQNSFRKWIGDKPVSEEGQYVYVTKTGSVYHKAFSCRSINLSVKQGNVSEVITLRGKNGQKYYECTRCDWKDSKKERIYYTDYGELYHKDIACSSLKRTIIKIKLDEVGSRRACSYCYE